jgi:hypothetical protein
MCLSLKRLYYQSNRQKPIGSNYNPIHCTYLDTQDKKATNHCVTNKHKVIEVFLFVASKLANRTFLGLNMMDVVQYVSQLKFQSRLLNTHCVGRLKALSCLFFRQIEVKLSPLPSLVYVDGLCDV